MNFSVVDDVFLSEFKAKVQQPFGAAVWQFLMLIEGYRIKVFGQEHVPPRSSFLLVSNHRSNWDPPLVYNAVRRPMAFMGKKELFQNPILGRLFRGLGTFEVDRNKMQVSTMKAVKKVLTSGNWGLCMFPEGTRHGDSAEAALGEMKRGAVTFAERFKVPILPVAIAEPQPKFACVMIGELIPYDPNRTEEDLTQLLVDRLTDLKQQGTKALD